MRISRWGAFSAIAAGWLAVVGAACGTTTTRPLPWLEEIARPLDETAVLDELAAAMRDRRLVLLGEATHGTHEFYTWRDRITRRLVEDAGFRFIAVEGDWASVHELNRYVNDLPGAAATAREALAAQRRWPTWLWANEETVALAEWLREWNASQPEERRVGIHGIDVYSPWCSADLLAAFAEARLPDAGERIERKLAPMRAHRDDIGGYVREYHRNQAPVLRGFDGLLELLREAPDDGTLPRVDGFAAKQGVHVLKGAHRHFMGMAEPGPNSWNRRAEHMHETVTRLLERSGPDARGIVWAHNTHIGDSRATSMEARGEVNIGRLARQSQGREAVFSLGFATHRGSVVAGRVWGEPLEVMEIPAAHPASFEALLDARFPEGALLRTGNAPDAARSETIGHRAIGVVYNPQNELGNYVPSRPADRYDAMIFLPSTGPLAPLDVPQ